MLKYLKEFYQRRVRAYSDSGVHLMDQFIRGSKPFDVIDNASNLLGNFMNVEAGRSNTAKALVHASKRTVAEIGFKGEFLEMFDLNATATIREAALTAEGFANHLYTDKDATMAMMSDAYSLVAVICYGRLGTYRGKKNEQAIYEMAAQLFGAAHLSKQDVAEIRAALGEKTLPVRLAATVL
jgi:hypothetical protein